MSLDIKLSRLAELDLEEIWLYTFEKWSLTQANYYQDNLYIGLNELASKTELGRSISIDNRTFHYYKIAHHYIFYQEQENTLFVYRILHEMMDFPRHL
ncbi:MAG: type II toxin-antitoxin system RelE/ParE family toxin [Chitinophagaceae bacterium]|nr:type II toxin-antitoxin system RelE/ParE family toxin [Chitinophagaceae bacterium]